MGVGFCVPWSPGDADATLAILRRHGREALGDRQRGRRPGASRCVCRSEKLIGRARSSGAPRGMRALIDDAVLGDMIEYIGREALRPVIELFLTESRELSAADRAVGAGDPGGREAVRKAAHSLKSSAGQLGAAALSEAAAAVERAAEGSAPLAELAAAVARLAAETGAALAERMRGP